MTVESVADFWAETDIGREVIRRGSAQTLTSALRVRFGNVPGIEVVANDLARWQDQDAAVAAIYEASTLADIPLPEDVTPTSTAEPI